MKLKRLAIICGGTGGHFYPGLSVARALKAQGGEPRLFIGGHKVGDQRKTAESHGVTALEIPSARLPKNPFAALSFIVKVSSGFLESRRRLREFKPDAVLGMGSFTSVPMALAAAAGSVPLFLHDGNARVGKANRFLSRFARLTMTAFPAVNPEAVRSPCVCAGMPLRPELVQNEIRPGRGRQAALRASWRRLQAGAAACGCRRWKSGGGDFEPVASRRLVLNSRGMRAGHPLGRGGQDGGGFRRIFQGVRGPRGA